MNEKKLIVMIMNCAVQELARFLSRSPTFNSKYTFLCFPNYGDDVGVAGQVKIVLEAVSRADVLIVQNVKSVDWLRNESLSTYTRKECQIIRLTFWRFDGFWPISADRQSESFWYCSDELADKTSFADYIGHDVAPSVIESHFEKEFEKFRTVDRESEFSMVPFFLENYCKHHLFSDAWHPTAIFYRHVAIWVLKQLDIYDPLPILPNDCINRDRYRLVFDSVASTLGLQFDPTYLHFFDKVVTRQVWYEFSRYADGRLTGQNTLDSQKLFDVWRDPETVKDTVINIALGMPAQQSSVSERSHPNDASRAVSGRLSGQFAMHTQVEPAPWWQVDLRELRQLTRLVIWNGDEGNLWLRLESTPMTIHTSLDGQQWEVLAGIHYPFGGKTSGKPLSLDFIDPVTTRYIRIQLQKTAALRLDQVEAYMNVTLKV